MCAPRPAAPLCGRGSAGAVEKDAGTGWWWENREKRGEKKRKREKGRTDGRGECDSREEEKPGASARAIYARITRVGSETPREGEKIKARARTFYFAEGWSAGMFFCGSDFAKTARAK